MQLPDLTNFAKAVSLAIPGYHLQFWVEGGKLRGFTLEANLASWNTDLDAYVERCFHEALLTDFVFDGTSHDVSAKSAGEEFKRSWHFYTVDNDEIGPYKPLRIGTYWDESLSRYVEPEDAAWDEAAYKKIVSERPMAS